MIVRLRQIQETLRTGLSTIPLLFGIAGVALALILLRIDGAAGTSYWPADLETTGSNAQAILSTVAGGLISAVTLLLSLALVAVQLGSSQFSPRTISNWLGDRVLQVAIGIVVGTIIFCLTVLQASDAVDEASFGVPHRSVFVAVVLTVISLLGVVRSVDHLAKSLRVGSVSQTILEETLVLINQRSESASSAGSVPLGPSVASDSQGRPSTDGAPVEAVKSGWVQQIDTDELLDTCPSGATITVVKPVGTFVLAGAPLARIHLGAGGLDDPTITEQAHRAFALGSGRTSQQDIPFGLIRLSDIGMRALSPGINDPNTAIDVLNVIATILLTLLEHPESEGMFKRESKQLVVPEHSHAEYVDLALSPVRRAAVDQPLVLTSIARLCEQISAEVIRRDLPASPEVFTPVLDALEEGLPTSGTSVAGFGSADLRQVQEAVEDARSMIGSV